jgi:hypothetical protein
MRPRVKWGCEDKGRKPRVLVTRVVYEYPLSTLELPEYAIVALLIKTGDSEYS